MLAQHYLKQLRRQNIVRLFSFIGALGLMFLVILKVENMLVSFALAFLINYLFSPSVSILERIGFRRVTATLLVFALATAFLSLLITLTLPLINEQLYSLRLELPKYISGVTQLMEELEERIESLTGSMYAIDLSAHVASTLEPKTRAFFEDLPRFITKSITVLLFAPFLAFFMVKDGRQISRSLLALVPNNIFEPTLSLFHQINEQMGHFVRARLLEALIVGGVTWIGLFIIDFPYTTLLALFAALTNLIPYIGPLIGAIPAIAIALINGETHMTLLLVIMIYMIAQIIDAALIIPIVVAKIVDLHPVTVMIAIIVGAQLMGVMGMLISIPVTSVLKLTLVTVHKHLTDFRS